MKKVSVYLILFFSCFYFLFAQETSVSKVYETFSWSPVNSAKKYEVIIEKQVDDTWEAYHSQIIKDCNFEYLFEPSVYRIRIVSINALGKKSQNVNWLKFRIIDEKVPYLYSLANNHLWNSPVIFIKNNVEQPDPNDVYITAQPSMPENSFELKGKNIFFEETSFTLIPIEQSLFNGKEYSGTKAGRKEVPLEIIQRNSKNNTVNLLYQPGKLKAGYYKLEANNPGGFTAQLSILVLTKESLAIKPVETDYSESYKVNTVQSGKNNPLSINISGEGVSEDTVFYLEPAAGKVDYPLESGLTRNRVYLTAKETEVNDESGESQIKLSQTEENLVKPGYYNIVAENSDGEKESVPVLVEASVKKDENHDSKVDNVSVKLNPSKHTVEFTLKGKNLNNVEHYTLVSQYFDNIDRNERLEITPSVSKNSKEAKTVISLNSFPVGKYVLMLESENDSYPVYFEVDSSFHAKILNDTPEQVNKWLNPPVEIAEKSETEKENAIKAETEKVSVSEIEKESEIVVTEKITENKSETEKESVSESEKESVNAVEKETVEVTLKESEIKTEKESEIKSETDKISVSETEKVALKETEKVAVNETEKESVIENKPVVAENKLVVTDHEYILHELPNPYFDKLRINGTVCVDYMNFSLLNVQWGVEYNLIEYPWMATGVGLRFNPVFTSFTSLNPYLGISAFADFGYPIGFFSPFAGVETGYNVLDFTNSGSWFNNDFYAGLRFGATLFNCFELRYNVEMHNILTSPHFKDSFTIGAKIRLREKKYSTELGFRGVDVHKTGEVDGNDYKEDLNQIFKINFTKGQTKISNFNSETVTYIYIPDSIVEIADGAFAGCKNLETIDCDIDHMQLERIGKEAFADCKKIRELKIPHSVKVIDTDAFKNWSDGQTIILDWTESDDSLRQLDGLQGIKARVYYSDETLYDTGVEINPLMLAKNWPHKFTYAQELETFTDDSLFENGEYKHCLKASEVTDRTFSGRYGWTEVIMDEDLLKAFKASDGLQFTFINCKEADKERPFYNIYIVTKGKGIFIYPFEVPRNFGNSKKSKTITARFSDFVPALFSNVKEFIIDDIVYFGIGPNWSMDAYETLRLYEFWLVDAKFIPKESQIEEK